MKRIGYSTIYLMWTILLVHTPAVAQELNGVYDSAYSARRSIVVTLAGGYTRSIMSFDIPAVLTQDGMAFSVRMALHPEHRLRMGLETGWFHLYSYEIFDAETSFGYTNASLSLSAIPLLAVFSMRVFDAITLHGGAGGYVMRSHTVSFGAEADVLRFRQGWMASLSWDHPVAPELAIGVEIKWYGVTEMGEGALLLQIRAPVHLHSW